ncbi:Molybdopterin biosynthesis protein [Candidatus Desulfarcum epimagneticum]|uniref:Molybdopterin molybdenumtransferase n=1 Tax=uncultured Desulfobacteraceae bacterium TaxID=218296 RepID=A0A484HH02_9BACT|nr:Molybdopterin biosynthesis protein [uncultured Desulfobacteraceae bacterium]
MGAGRNIYLDMKTLGEAREIVEKSFGPFGRWPGESVPSAESAGRVLAGPVFAAASSPAFNAAAMDGIAVRAADTFGAAESAPKTLWVGKEAVYVNTGHVMPPGTDAVIMIEHVHEIDEKSLEIEAPAFPWQNVRKMGEDIVATELLFPGGHVITPYCVGALLSGGVFFVSVKKKPRVLIIPTGSELLDWRDTDPLALKPGQVIETHSTVLGGLVESCGGAFSRTPILKDDPAAIQKAALDAAGEDFDLILLTGGSSAGSEDYSKKTILESGEVLVHGVTMMPGKPVIIGKISGKPAFGVPGYPVSAIIVFERLIRPLIRRMLGQPDPEPRKTPVSLAKKVASKLGVEEFLRVKLGKVDDRVVAMPLPRGAGSVTSIVDADGILRIPNHIEGLNEDDPVEAELIRPLSEIESRVVIVGSHDNALDVLADLAKADSGGVSVSSSHVGSMGGLMAVKKGVCHMAGSHLLDEADGSYNISYIQKYLPDLEVRLVRLAGRDQGLMVPPGNPRGVKGIESLRRPDIVFVNRQAGSGTRILLDFKLKESDVAASEINGYFNEEHTHMSVAAAVLSGAADAGLGIYAAAKSLGLDFVPVVTEEYDLVIPGRHFQTRRVKTVLDIIASAAFKRRISALGGYHVERTGDVIL